MAALSRLGKLVLALWVAGSVRQAPLLVEERVVEGFRDAVRLAVAPQGTMLVVEREEHAVVLVSAEGTTVRRVGGYGWSETTFDGPSGVATDGLNVLVSDRENHRIQRFDRRLTYVATLATRDTTLPALRFGFPEGLALSRQGDLYVLDGEGLRVVKFGVTGQFERSFGESERGRGKLTAPRDIAVTPDERVLVLEPNRVVEFDAFGNVVRTIGDGLLEAGAGLAATESGLAVVTSGMLHWFREDGSSAWSVSRKDLITSRPIGELRDVGLAGDRLYLLTAGEIFMFRQR